MGEPFSHQYAEFNEDGLVSMLRCLCCGTPVGGLSEVPSQKFPGRTFSRLRRYANFRIGDARLSNGTRCDIFLCGDCVEVDLDPHVRKISRQLRAAWVGELEANHRPKSHIDQVREQIKDLHVLTKAEVLAGRTTPEAQKPVRDLPEEAPRAR